MFVDPVPTAVANPVFAPIIATAVLDDSHIAVLVRFCVLPSEKCPVAVNACVAPAAIEALVGVTEIEVSVGGGSARKKSLRSFVPELAAPPSSGVTPKISWNVFNIELWS